MKKGDRVYYTGDMANWATEGTITACVPAGKYNPESVNIAWDQKRFEDDYRRESLMVPIIMFSPGSGRRFYLLEEWEAERKVHLEAMRKRMKAMFPEPKESEGENE